MDEWSLVDNSPLPLATTASSWAPLSAPWLFHFLGSNGSLS